MKILSFNCSPRMKRSNTDRILNPLLEGASKAGAEVERIYVRKLDLKPCLGCYSCWLKTPGACAQKDDWNEVLMKQAEADLIIYATPVYALNMTVYMKTLMERTGMLVILPFAMEPIGYGFRHFARYPDIEKKAFLVANGLGWGDAVFGLLVDNFDAAIRLAVDEEGKPIMDIAGKILVGCGELMEWEETPQKALEPFYQALRDAGEELVREGSLSPQTEEKLNVPLWTYLGVEADEAMDFLGDYFRRLIERDVQTTTEDP